MNGIAFLTLAVAFQGGIEFGWTQLPDDRVEYIIQLDDKAMEALKNGQPLTSSIPPEVKNADRIRIQYGGNVLDKPVLSKKPQSFHPTPYSNTAAGTQDGFRNTIADSTPSIHPNVRNDSRIRDGGLSGQVTVTDGNVSSVSNSTMNGARRTSFVTPQGTNNAISHWRDSNRVINNFDNQNRTADSRANLSGTGSNTFGNPNTNNTGFTGSGTSSTATTNPNLNGGTNTGLANTGLANTGLNNTGLSNTGTASTNTGVANTNVAQPNSNFNLNTGSNRTGFSGTNTNPTGSQLNNTATGFGGNMAPVPNRTTNGNNWNSVSIPKPNMTSFQNPNTNLSPNNLNTATNPNLMANANNGSAIPQNNFPNAQNYNPQVQPTGNQFVQQPTTGIGYPVNMAAPSNEVAMMNKRLDEWEAEKKQQKHDAEIAKLKEDQAAELEKLTAQFKEFQKKKDDKSDAGGIVTQAKDETNSRGTSSGIASVFLVISLGLNVFLVVQYLSVQNQFRDLSNDLRDTFMTNTYE